MAKKPTVNEGDLKLGELIKEYRLKNNYSQKEIADKLGYTQPVFVSLLENGVSKFPLQTLGELIVMLNIPEKKVMKLLIEAYETKVQSEIVEGKKRRA